MFSRTSGTRWFFLFFFISGFCGLLYEVVWLRLSMAKFGVTTPMVSIVLSVFMAGLGLGSWTGGKLMRRVRGAAIPLRLYAALELCIGLSGLVVPMLIDTGYHLLRDAGHGFAWGSSLYYLASGSWMALALLPWCTAMGATFPFAMAAIAGLSDRESPHSFSYLYLSNVLGAAAGALVPAIFFIELFGFRGTLRVASALNAVLAAMVFLFSLSLRGESSAAPRPAAKTAPVHARADLLWLLFTTGLCSMAMEVIWTRQYTVYLGNVVYAFAAILAVYLLATFLGSTLYRRAMRERRDTSGPGPWILLGVAALLPLLFADPRFFFGASLDDPSFFLGLARAGLGMGPFSAVAGFLTPMLVDRWSGGDPDRAGRAYGVNVMGSILGPLLAGFWILPWAGERWGLCLLALPLFAAAWMLASRSAASLVFRVPAREMFAYAAGAAVLLAAAARGYERQFADRVELRDYAATVIASGQGMGRRLLVNGIGMTKLTPITKMMAHLPLAMLPRPASRGLVICFGMGTTFRSMLSWGIPSTVVELVPSVPKLFGYYHPDGPALLASPEARVVIDDGRRFLERSPEKFDVIVTDPPPPLEAPASSLLYSEEFYAVAKSHLAAGGIMQVWCPGGDDTSVASIAKALRNSFPYVRAYESVEGWGLHFLASADPLPTVGGDDLARRLPPRAAADLVEWNAGATPSKIFSDLLSREKTLDSVIAADAAVAPITDNRPVNEYYLLRTRGADGQ